MFTGIIEEVGIIKAVQNGHIEIGAKKVLEGTKIGDSIAVNGVCLTVTKMTSSHFFADVMNETFSRSNLSSLFRGDKVNLERYVAWGKVRRTFCERTYRWNGKNCRNGKRRKRSLGAYIR